MEKELVLVVVDGSNGVAVGLQVNGAHREACSSDEGRGAATTILWWWCCRQRHHTYNPWCLQKVLPAPARVWLAAIFLYSWISLSHLFLQRHHPLFYSNIQENSSFLKEMFSTIIRKDMNASFARFYFLESTHSYTSYDLNIFHTFSKKPFINFLCDLIKNKHITKCEYNNNIKKYTSNILNTLFKA